MPPGVADGTPSGTCFAAAGVAIEDLLDQEVGVLGADLVHEGYDIAQRGGAPQVEGGKPTYAFGAYLRAIVAVPFDPGKASPCVDVP